MFEAEQHAINQRLSAFCAEKGLPNPDLNWTWIPFNGHWGICTSFFQLAAREAREGKAAGPVPSRAAELAQMAAEAVGLPDGFERVEAVKGYLNLYFSTANYASRLIDSVLDEKQEFGRGKAKGERVMIEFSQPNTHKAFHVGHLRSAILGDALCRLLDFAGYDVVRANYPGDIGLHVIKWLWNYMNFHAGERPETNITEWMGKIYAEANRRLEENPELEAEVRALYSRWDQRDPEVVALWTETRQWSLDGFDEMYRQLDIRFDRYYFNSMAEQPGKEVVAELIEKGLATDDRPNNGTVFVDLDARLGLKEKYRVLVVLRSDGTALYATEDLALAKLKFSDYPDLARSYYVVDVRQSLHFQQVFKTLELAGYPWAKHCQHVPYELVNLPGNVVMASREGTVVLLEHLIAEAVSRALEVVEQKNPDLTAEQKLAVARAVGIGAIKYPMLARENAKIVTFDWKTALDFDGQAAPYIQYAYVRGGSILRKAGGEIPAAFTPTHTLQREEVALVDAISRFPSEVQRAAGDLRPLAMATQAYDLARAFNDFYTGCPVLSAEPEVRAFRLRLVAAARQAIGNALALLGITAPEAM
ncbi:MAG TPA: arginine--tRNA ligase [Anaerolineaceae bacterium]|nr:arginine--tRNA ligase [Anaerolineaceae bacterium]HPN52205.1 arginine--tRNA ligase [Anaerolineaceae bacterium]